MKLRSEVSEASDLLGLGEAAALLGAPESTLRYWRWQGTGPESFKVGRRVVYRREALLAWVERQAALSRKGG